MFDGESSAAWAATGDVVISKTFLDVRVDDAKSLARTNSWPCFQPPQVEAFKVTDLQALKSVWFEEQKEKSQNWSQGQEGSLAPRGPVLSMPFLHPQRRRLSPRGQLYPLPHLHYWRSTPQAQPHLPRDAQGEASSAEDGCGSMRLQILQVFEFTALCPQTQRLPAESERLWRVAERHRPFGGPLMDPPEVHRYACWRRYLP
eukprot:s687_g29.t1